MRRAALRTVAAARTAPRNSSRLPAGLSLRGGKRAKEQSKSLWSEDLSNGELANPTSGCPDSLGDLITDQCPRLRIDADHELAVVAHHSRPPIDCACQPPRAERRRKVLRREPVDDQELGVAP